MIVQDFQRKSWERFITTDIHKTLKASEITTETMKISFSLSPHCVLNSTENFVNAIKNKESCTKDILVDCKVELLGGSNASLLGRSVTLQKKALTIPAHTPHGFIINGTRYIIMNNYKKVRGWHLYEEKDRSSGKSTVLPVLTCSTIFGGQLKFFLKRGEVRVMMGKTREVGLGDFLVAMTSLNYSQIIEEIGENFRYITTTFRNEQPVEICAPKVARDFKLSHSQNHKEAQLALHDKLFNPNRFMLGDESRMHLKYISSFQNRCENMVLAKEVLGLEKGTILSHQLLQRLDESDLKEIWVMHQGKPFKILKYPVKDTLCAEELFTVLNMYFLALDGVGHYQDRDSFDNKIVESVSEFFSQKLYQNLQGFISELKSDSSYTDIESLVRIIERAEIQKDDFIKDLVKSDVLQLAEETNLMSMISKGYKVSNIGLEERSATNQMRDIKANQYGRVCPVETPEGKKVGLVHTLSTSSDIDNFGFVTTSYYEINNCERGRVVKKNALEEKNHYIAPYDADFTQREIYVRYNDDYLLVPREKVTLQEMNAIQVFSPSVSTIPFLEQDDSKRAMMAANMSSQAVVPIKPERPIVSTGVDGSIDIGVIRGKDIMDLAYQYYSNQITPEQKEMLYNGKVKLVSIHQKLNQRVATFKVDLPDKMSHVEYVLTTFKPTFKDTMQHIRVNTKLGDIFAKDDIVLHSSDIDITEKKIFSTNESSEKGIAIGKNLKVLFKTFEGYNYEDAIVINADLYRDKILSDLTLDEIEVVLEDINSDKPEESRVDIPTSKLENISPKLREHLTNDGLPKKGVYLTPGQILVGKITRTAEGDKETPRYLKYGEGGYVIDAYTTKDRIIVTLGKISDIEVGDKLAGRHGNKGVIAKIVEPEDMPFLEDGTIPDVIMSPLGVPSRMNIGQTSETSLGSAMRTLGMLGVVPPFSKNNQEILRKALELAGDCEVDVWDGRTGKKFPRKMMFGVMYILKLEHKVSKKINAINFSNDNIDMITNLPKAGRANRGGQRFGEMESWALQSHGSTKVLQDFYSVQSDDTLASSILKGVLKKDPLNFNVTGISHNDVTLRMFARCLGFDIEGDAEGVSLRFLTNKDILAISNGKVQTQNADALYDPVIFGETALRKRDKWADRELWGHIELECEYINPSFYKTNFFKNLFLATVHEEGNSYNRMLSANHINDIRETKFFVHLKSGFIHVVKSKDVERFIEVTGYDPDDLIGGEMAIIEMCKMYDVNQTLDKLRHLVNTTKSRKTKYKINKSLSAFESFFNRYELKDIVLDKVLVPPIGFRPAPKNSKQKFGNDLDVYYMGLVDFCNERGRGYHNKYKRLQNHLASAWNNSSKKDSKTKSIIRMLTHKKKGFMRGYGLAKRLQFSGRSVITVKPTLRPDECGLPLPMLLTLYEPMLTTLVSKHYKMEQNDAKHIIQSIANKNNIYLQELIQKWSLPKIDQLKNEVQQILRDFLKEQQVILIRQPSLHKHNALSFIPTIAEGNSIQIYPLVTPGYNADFDGDQMAAIPIINNVARREAENKMSVYRNIVLSKNGEIVLNHSQDMVLGVFYATMLPDNRRSWRVEKLPQYFKSINELEDSLYLGTTEINEVVLIRVGGRLYISTAGRVLFNNCFPLSRCFTDKPYEIRSEVNVGHLEKYKTFITMKGLKPEFYHALEYDDVIDKGTLAKINKKIYNEMNDPFTTLNIYDRIKDLGFKWADLGAISIGLSDFEQPEDIKKMVDEGIEEINILNKAYFRGLISDEERTTASVAKWDRLRDIISSKLETSVSRNTNLNIMKISGARGSKGTFLQIMGTIGKVVSLSGQAVPTLVTSNYTRGLPLIQYFTGCYGTRRNVTATSVDTAEAGYATRSLVFMLQDLIVKDSACSAEAQEVSVRYDDFKDSKSEIISKFNMRKLSSSDPHYYELKDLLNFNGTIYTENRIKNTLLLIAGRLGLRHLWIVDGSGSHKMSIPYKGANLDMEKAKEVFRNLSLSPEDPNWKELKDSLNFDGTIYREEQIHNNAFDYVKKNKIRKLLFEDGEVKISYKMHRMSRTQLIHRTGGKELPHLENGYITDKTLDWIESQQLDKISAFLSYGCKHVKGICQRCYGLTYTHAAPPPEGANVSVDAAQAIGEPSTQLTMNTFHSGLASTSLKGGVQLLMKLLTGGGFSKEESALVAKTPQKVSVSDPIDGMVEIVVDGKYHKVPYGNQTVVDGEYVKAGDALTVNYYNFPELVNFLAIEQVREKLLEAYYDTYMSNNLDVMARHFELVVKMQTSFSEVYESNDDEFLPGTLALTQDLENSIARGKKIVYSPVVIGRDKIVTNSRNVLTSLAFQGFTSNLLHHCVYGTVDKLTTPMGKMVAGVPLTGNSTKSFEIPEFRENELVSRENGLIVNEAIPVEAEEIGIELLQVDDVPMELEESDVFELSDLDFEFPVQGESNFFNNLK